MNKTLYIHVGLHKTGTTAIQNFLAINREILKTNGVLYPGKSENHYDISEELRSDCKAFLNKKTETNKIFNEIFQEQDNYDNFIISSEGFLEFIDFTIPALNETIKYFNLNMSVKIIIYLRSQLSWIESIYQQRIKQTKTRNKLTIDQFIKFENILLFDHYKLLKYLSNTFGKENLNIRMYLFEKADNKIFDDFLSILNIPNNVAYTYPNKANLNIGLPKESIEFLRWLNILEIHDDIFSEISNLLSQQEINELEKYHFLSYEMANEIKDFYFEINKKIANDFFSETDRIKYLNNENRTFKRIIDQNNLESIDLPKQIEIIKINNQFILFRLYQFLINMTPENEEVIKLSTFIQNSIIELIPLQEIKKMVYLGSSFEAEDLIKSIENIETIIKIDSDNFMLSSFNFSTETKLHISDINKEVHIISYGIDPYFQIINFRRNNTQAYIIKIKICAPKDTILKVYFQIINNPFFNESNTIFTNLTKGENEKYILITHSGFNGNIRIDPGITEGLFIIHEIQIYSAQLI